MSTDRSFFASLNEAINVNPPPATVSGYVEGNRILPQSAPYPGPLRNEVSPYMVEIMDNNAPSSIIKHTILMKGVQLTATTGGENVIGYYMDVDPSAIMYMSATEASLKIWGDTRLEDMLNSLGIRDKISASISPNRKSRSTGDTATKKEFPGGFLLMASAQAPNAMRSSSIRILIRDEIDGAPINLTTGEGNWLDVSEGRTSAFEAIRKIFDYSTPTTFQQSNILRQYNKGDKRFFNVPCPICGELQVLEMGNSRTKHGLKPYYDTGGRLDHACYVCRFCEGKMYDHHKKEMLKIESMGGTAKWIPTVEAVDKFTRSYQISSLYSPPGFTTWTAMYQKYIQAEGDEEARRAFVNLFLGLPYKLKGTQPKMEKLIALKDGSLYQEGEVPQEVIFLTMAIDVQTGKDARLAIEILGHGRDFKTASIVYKEIKGEVKNRSEGAWKGLDEWIGDSDKWKFRRKDGALLWPMLAFVDSGDGNTMHTVYGFCDSHDGFFPIKGFQTLTARNRNPDSDYFDLGKDPKYQIKKRDQNQILVKINTNMYKSQIYDNLDISRPDMGIPLPRGFCDFPYDRGEEYFQMLRAEERDTAGNFHAEGRRNESLDVGVYNRAAGDYYLGEVIRKSKQIYSKDLEPGEELTQNELFEAALNELESQNLETIAPIKTGV